MPSDNLEVNEGESGKMIRSVYTGGGVHVPLDGISLPDVNDDWSVVRRRLDAVKVSLENVEAGIAEQATLESIEAAVGDETSASQVADSSKAATLIERVTALVDVLTSGRADDEIRVALATDLLSGDLDVNLNSQNGDISVSLSDDSLTGNLDVDLAEISHGTVTVTDDGNFVLSDMPATAADGAALPSNAVVVAGDDGTDTHLLQLNGDNLRVSIENDTIDLPTETTLAAVQAAVEAIDDALASNGTDTVRVSTPSAIDASASEIDVNLNTDSLAGALDVDVAAQSLSPIAVELSSDALSGNLDVDLAEASAQPIDVSAATVPVEQQTPVQLEDSSGTNIDPATSSDVGAIESAIGDETIASEQADSALAATLLERVTALVDVLTSGQADDELRVALTKDLLSGDLDVNLNAQSGAVDVNLSGDALTSNLDVDLADISHGTVTVTDDGSFVLSDMPATSAGGSTLPSTAVVVAGDDGNDTRLLQLNGDNLQVSVENDTIDLPTETTLSAVQSAVEAIDDALGSNATDTLRISTPAAIDASAAEIDVNLNTDSLAGALDIDLAEQSLSPIKVELDADSLTGNLDVDIAEASAQPLDVSASTVPVEQQTPVQLEDSQGTNIDPAASSDVGAVQNVLGDETTASQESDSSFSATLLERVTSLVDALTSGQADDELRVALASDLLSGNIDIDVAEQSTGNITVELAADSLTGNLDVDLAAQTSGALDVSGATVPTEQQTPIQLENSSGTNIDPATEGTLNAIKTAAQALDDALVSNATDEIRVTSPNPLDVSAAEVDVDLNSQTLANVSVDLNAQSGPALDVSGATVTVTDDGSLTLAANDGTDIGDVGIEDISSITGQATKSASIPVTLASDEDTVPTEQQSPVQLEDSQGTNIDPATDPGIRGGATQQDIVDAIYESALSQQTVNEEGTLITDATSAQTTSAQTSGVYKGVMVFVNIDDISGTSPELTARVQRKTPGGVAQDILSTGTLTSSGLTTLQVHPSLSDSANARAGELLGREWQVDVALKTSAGNESYQYDIEYVYVN